MDEEYFYRTTLQDPRGRLHTWGIVEKTHDLSLTQMRQGLFALACAARQLTPQSAAPVDLVLMRNTLIPGMYSCELTMQAGGALLVEPWTVQVNEGTTAQQLFAYIFKGSCDKHRLNPQHTHTLNTFIARE